VLTTVKCAVVRLPRTGGAAFGGAYMMAAKRAQDIQDAEREERDAVGDQVGGGGVVMCSFRLRIVHDKNINEIRWQDQEELMMKLFHYCKCALNLP
jgi:hypothetical protein